MISLRNSASPSPLTTDNEKGYSLRVLMVNIRLLSQDLVANGKGMEALIQAQQLNEIVESIQTRKITNTDEVWRRIQCLGLEANIERILEENQKGVESLMKESKSLNYFLTKSMSRMNDGIKNTSYTPNKKHRGIGISRHSKDMMMSTSAVHDKPSERYVSSFIGQNILQSTATSWYKAKKLKHTKKPKRSVTCNLPYKPASNKWTRPRARSCGFSKRAVFSQDLQRVYRIPWDLDLETALRGTERYVVPWNRF